MLLAHSLRFIAGGLTSSSRPWTPLRATTSSILDWSGLYRVSSACAITWVSLAMCMNSSRPFSTSVLPSLSSSSAPDSGKSSRLMSGSLQFEERTWEGRPWINAPHLSCM